MISGKLLTFVPYKGRFKGKLLKIPSPLIALNLIDARKGSLFADCRIPILMKILN